MRADWLHDERRRPTLAGLESLGELVGFGAVFDPIDEIGAREATLSANAGGRDGSLSGGLVSRAQ